VAEASEISTAGDTFSGCVTPERKKSRNRRTMSPARAASAITLFIVARSASGPGSGAASIMSQARRYAVIADRG